MFHQDSFTLHTRGRGTTEITEEIQGILGGSGIQVGLATVFVHHTSASLIVCENADPSVRRDLETWMGEAVLDGDPSFRHTCEGPDDMASHIRSILTSTSLSVPIRDGRCDLGTWQGIYLWEHRTHPHRRRISVTIQGE